MIINRRERVKDEGRDNPQQSVCERERIQKRGKEWEREREKVNPQNHTYSIYFKSILIQREIQITHIQTNEIKRKDKKEKERESWMVSSIPIQY